MRSEVHDKGYKRTLHDLPEGEAAATADIAERLYEQDPTVVATSRANATILTLARVPHTTVAFFMVPNDLDASFMERSDWDTERLIGVTTAPKLTCWLTDSAASRCRSASGDLLQ